MEPGQPQISKWVMDIFEDWENKLSVLLSAPFNKPLCHSDRENIAKIKAEAEKTSGWRREWMLWQADAMQAKSDSGSVEKGQSKNGMPPWLERIEMELASAASPTVNFRAVQQKRFIPAALILGEMIGHEFAMWHADNSGLAVSLDRLPPEFQLLPKAILEDHRKKRLEYVREVVAIAVRQPFKDVRQFFRGFSMAMQKGSMTEQGELAGATSTTKIYTMFAFYSDFVLRLQSVHELHEWLCMMLGKLLIGDIKRVEKICERIGLNFRPPGRPETRP
jgi:hypothetical protein